MKMFFTAILIASLLSITFAVTPAVTEDKIVSRYNSVKDNSLGSVSTSGGDESEIASGNIEAVSLPGASSKFSTKIVKCESWNFHPKTCYVGGRVISVRLVKQLSKSKCIYGYSYFKGSYYIRVIKGCRGIFAVLKYP